MEITVNGLTFSVDYADWTGGIEGPDIAAAFESILRDRADLAALHAADLTDREAFALAPIESAAFALLTADWRSQPQSGHAITLRAVA